MSKYALRNILKDESYLFSANNRSEQIKLPPYKPGQVLVDRKFVCERNELGTFYNAEELSDLKAKLLIVTTPEPKMETYHFYIDLGERFGKIEVYIEAPDEYFSAGTKELMFDTANGVLESLFSLDDVARSKFDHGGNIEIYEPILCAVTIKACDLELEYVSTKVNTSWRVYFVVSPNGEWEYIDWG